MPEPNDRDYPALDAAIERAIAPLKSGRAPLTLLYSGGVDSSLLAWELRDRPGLVLLTVGTPGSPDLGAGRSGARMLGLEWTAVTVTASDAARMGVGIADFTGGVRPISRSVLLALGLALERSPTREAVVGQGIDELFLGYAHFRGLDPDPAATRATADLDCLLREDWPATRAVATWLGRTVVAPYLAPRFVEAAQAVPIERRLPAAGPKRFFREWARHRGLPGELADRPKRAMQYGSGVDRLRRTATRD